MIIYENPWFRIVKEQPYHWIEPSTGADGVAVLPVVGDSLLLLEMQRPSQGGQVTLEIPRGFGQAGESAVASARRELKEETGYDLPEQAFQLLGHVRPDTGIMKSRVALFKVQIDADAPVGQADDEAKGRRMMPLTELPAALGNGQIEDGFTLSALALWQALRR